MDKKSVIGKLVHDINNPLGSIYLLLDQLEMELGGEELDPAQLKDVLSRLIRNADRLRDIVRAARDQNTAQETPAEELEAA